ncbi:MAG: hypothetical protein WCP45_17230, partial [Verrucomicrobiota bacterium]
PATALPTGSNAARERNKKSAQRPKPNRLMAKLVLGWLVTTVLLALAIRWIWPEDVRHNAGKVSSIDSVKGSTGDESVVKLRQAMIPCCNVLSGFLSANTPEERNQFVLNSVATAGRMARFYSLNSLTRIDPKKVTNTVNTLLDLPTGQALESRWHTTDGRTFDSVFIQQDGEWHLDWDHFARYGDYPWSLFIAGDGPQEVELRLLVRERLAQERNESPHMSLAFYAPRFGYPDQIDSHAPEFLVRRDSTDGRLLAAAFKQHAAGEGLYGSKLASMEAQGMIRVRVKIRRSAAEAESSQKFELVKVIACHWLAIDDPGVQPLEPAPTQDTPKPPPSH